MPHQGLQAGRHFKRLEHMAAYKIGEVAHRLHRHGLVKQLQRLLVFNAKAAAKPSRVGGETLVQGCALGTQTLFQLGDFAAKVGKVGRDGQGAFGTQKKAPGLALSIFKPKHLRQADGLLVSRVVEHAQDHGVSAGCAQADGFGAAREVAALGLVMPQHIRAQIPFFVASACGLVVGDALGGHQQGGDGINQGGFARADVAREQGVFAV